MDAANPLCRFVLLAAGLAAVIGCNSDGQAPRARGQMPQDPLAPLAPPPPPNIQNAPAAPPPAGPVQPVQGLAPAGPGAPIIGTPVAPDARGPVVRTGYTGVNTKVGSAAAQLLSNSVPRVKVVAIVGANNVITDQEVIESVWQHNDELMKLEGRERERKIKELYTAALRKTIERELILDDMYAKLKKANKQNVIEEIRELSVQTVDRQVREMKKKMGIQTDEEFATWLRLQGLTVPVLRRQLERQVMSQQYLNSMMRDKARRVGLAEIRDYYDKHPQEFQTADRVRWQHVFVSLRNHGTAEAASKQAEAIRQGAAGGSDFGELARRYDEGFAKMQGGFGTGEARGKIQPPDLEEAVWSLKPGQMSGVIQTATGYHLVKVVEREYAGVQPFDVKVQAKIREKLGDAAIDADTKKLVDDLWRKGTVRVLEE